MSTNGSNIGKIGFAEVISFEDALRRGRTIPHLKFAPVTSDLRRQLGTLLLREDIGIAEHNYGHNGRKVIAEKRPVEIQSDALPCLPTAEGEPRA